MEKITEIDNKILKNEQKRAVSHCLNLECKKEQLLILIEKLSNISGQRLGLISGNKGDKEPSSNFGFRKSSISEELRFAEENIGIIDIEIKNARHKLKVIEKIITEKPFC